MRQFSRRQFFEDSFLAAAMAGAFPMGSLMAEENQPEPKKADGDDKLRVAVVGVRGRGNDHIGNFLKHSDTVITHIVDVDENIGQACVKSVAERQGSAPQFVRDLRAVLDDKSVDIVSIATPNHWHSLGAIWAMQAGKDVYVEKPLSHNVSEGRRAVEAARKHHRVCQVGTQCRSMKGTAEAIQYVHDGKIGEVKLARGICYRVRNSIGPKGDYKVPAEVDYNLWCGPSRMLPLTRKNFHYDWHWQREWGNGDIGNQGPHQMDIARWGLGIDRLGRSVISYGGRLGFEDAGDVANTEVAIIESGDKTIVFEVRGRKSDPYRGASVGVVFYGSEGMVVLSDYRGGAAFDRDGKQVVRFHDGNDFDHYCNFIEAVKARDPKRLNADVLEGHLSCAHSHLANVSYYLGQKASVDEIKKTLESLKTNEDVAECLDRTVQYLEANEIDLAKTPLTLGPMLKIDSENETIIDHPEANVLLTREYRDPFIVPKAGEV